MIFSRVSDWFCPTFLDIIECQIHWTFGPWMPDHYAASKRKETNTQWHRITFQNNGDLNCTAAEAEQLESLTFALTSDAEIPREFCEEIILICVQYCLQLQFTIITQAQFNAPETGLMEVGLNWLQTVRIRNCFPARQMRTQLWTASHRVTIYSLIGMTV